MMSQHSNNRHPRHGANQQPEKSGHRALRRGRVSLSNHVYLVTSATMGRECFFADFHAGCAAARCFEASSLLGEARMLAWVLMPDHPHWLVQLGEEDTLGLVVNRIKSASARMANRVLQRKGPLWEPAYHDHCLRREEDLRSVARYMVANPVRAGLVQRIGDYPFWNAIWF
jgi:REP element-mobilizing transposase RayT